VSSPDWHCIRVSYRDTPNFTGEPVSQRLSELLIHPDWVADRARKWGEASALFTSKCEGEFPHGTSPFTVVPVSWLERSMSLELVPDVSFIEAGLDVGGGGDRTILRLRHGPKLGPSFSFVDSDPVRSIGQVAVLLREHNVRRVKVDSNGVGWGVYGALRSSSSMHAPPGTPEDQIIHDAEVVPVNFGEGPTPGKESRFLNKRAEAYWNVRELVRLDRVDMEAIDDDTKQELSTPTYEVLDAKGKVKIQPKKDIIKLLGRSPDEADAIAYALWDSNREMRILNDESVENVDLNRGLEPGDWMRSMGAVSYEPGVYG
jgi:hypothetical protein